MTILTNKSRKSNNNPSATFTIALQDESVQFNPSKTFAHVDSTQVLKIITKGKLEACAVNQKKFINYQLTNENKILGFINFYDNGLDDMSSIDEIDNSVSNLTTELSAVKLTDITLPMSADEADAMIAGL